MTKNKLGFDILNDKKEKEDTEERDEIANLEEFERKFSPVYLLNLVTKFIN